MASHSTSIVEYPTTSPTPTAWIAERLSDQISKTFPLPGHKYSFDQHLLFIDESLFSRHYDLDRLFERKLNFNDQNWPEDENRGKYLLTYASDTAVCIRTLISINILRQINNNNIERELDEPQLSYTNGVGGGEQLANENFLIGEKGKRKFTLKTKKYQFRTNYDARDRGAFWLTLIVEDGKIIKRDNGDYHDRFPHEFDELWLNDENLYGELKKRYPGVPIHNLAWEVMRRRRYSKDIQRTNGRLEPEAPSQLYRNDENGQGNSSRLLSAMVDAATFDLTESNDDDDHRGTSRKRKRDLLSSEENDDAMCMIRLRGARTQTDPKYTKWTSKMDLRQASYALLKQTPPPLLINLATPPTEQSGPYTVDSGDGIVITYEPRPSTDQASQTSPNVSDKNIIDLVTLLEKPREKPAVEEMIIIESSTPVGRPILDDVVMDESPPARGSVSVNAALVDEARANISNRSDNHSSNAGTSTKSKKINSKHSNLVVDLQEAFRHFNLPGQLREKCVDVLLSKKCE